MKKFLISLIALSLVSACDSDNNSEALSDQVAVNNLISGHYIGSTVDSAGDVSLAYGFYGDNDQGFVFTVDNENEQASRIYIKQQVWQSNSDQPFSFARKEKWLLPYLHSEDAVGNYQVWHDEMGPLVVEIKAGGAIEVTGKDRCYGVGSLGDNIGNGISLSLSLKRCGNEAEATLQGLLWQVDNEQMQSLRLVSFSENTVIDWHLH